MERFYFFPVRWDAFFLISIPFFFVCLLKKLLRWVSKKKNWKPFLRCSEPGNSILYREEEHAGVYTLWFFLSGFFFCSLHVVCFSFSYWIFLPDLGWVRRRGRESNKKGRPGGRGRGNMTFFPTGSRFSFFCRVTSFFLDF